MTRELWYYETYGIINLKHARNMNMNNDECIR